MEETKEKSKRPFPRDDVRRTTRIIQIDKMLRGGSFVKIDDLIF